MTDTIKVSIWRGGAKGHYQPYEVPLRAEPDRARRRHVRAAPPRSDAVLSLCLPGRHVRLLRHDRERPPALDLPHPCRKGHPSGGRIEIGPLENLPVIKDLATDMRPFFEKWQQAKGTFVPSTHAP